jgi:hypothetical protein
VWESFFVHYEFKTIGFGAMFFLKTETIGLFTSVLSSILQLLHIIAKDREWCCDCCVSAAIWWDHLFWSVEKEILD